jgi:hypothetical protein
MTNEKTWSKKYRDIMVEAACDTVMMTWHDEIPGG